jgi:hypothetical protein
VALTAGAASDLVLNHIDRQRPSESRTIRSKATFSVNKTTWVLVWMTSCSVELRGEIVPRPEDAAYGPRAAAASWLLMNRYACGRRPRRPR